MKNLKAVKSYIYIYASYFLPRKEEEEEEEEKKADLTL